MSAVPCIDGWFSPQKKGGARPRLLAITAVAATATTWPHSLSLTIN